MVSLNKLNNRGVGVIDLMVGIIMLTATVFLLSNFISLERAALNNNRIYVGLTQAINQELACVRSYSNWSNLEGKTVQTMRNEVLIEYEDYVKEKDTNKESIKLKATCGEKVWMYEVERVN